MSFRILSAALLLGALAVTGSQVQASGGGNKEQCETRECELKFFNPPILKVSECIEINCLAAKIRVQTNCHTIVTVDCDDAFKRFERDLDCKKLKTYDTIPARCAVKFLEDPQCKDGGEFRVKQVAKETWKVESHRGGYWIFLACVPYGRELCDDCGCYELDCAVRVCTLPCEEEADCCAIVVPPGPPTVEKGNNGVGNGLDPQPPGNPPINDGPGTGPGNPGNQGGV